MSEYVIVDRHGHQRERFSDPEAAHGFLAALPFYMRRYARVMEKVSYLAVPIGGNSNPVGNPYISTERTAFVVLLDSPSVGGSGSVGEAGE